MTRLQVAHHPYDVAKDGGNDCRETFSYSLFGVHRLCTFFPQAEYLTYWAFGPFNRPNLALRLGCLYDYNTKTRSVNVLLSAPRAHRDRS